MQSQRICHGNFLRGCSPTNYQINVMQLPFSLYTRAISGEEWRNRMKLFRRWTIKLKTEPSVLPRRSKLQPGFSFRNFNIVILPVTAVCSNAKKKILPDIPAQTQQDRNSTHPPHNHSSPAPCSVQGLALASGCTSHSVCSWVFSVDPSPVSSRFKETLHMHSKWIITDDR